MARSPVAQRYARALFELAREQGRLEAVAADLSALKTLRDHREAFETLAEPYALSPERRMALWRAILENKADPLTLRFALFLVHKGRGQLIGSIIAAFEALHLDAQGIQPVDIVSARPLPDDQLREITTRMEKRLGRRIQPTVEVDPALLGGFLVRAGDVVHDFSVNHQLEQLHQRLTTA